MMERLIAMIKEIEESEPSKPRGRLKWSNGVRDDQVVIVGNKEAVFRLGCELVKASALDDQRIEELKQFFDGSSKVHDVVIVVRNEKISSSNALRSQITARARIWRAIIRVLKNGRD
jgi:malonyl CoA-acyl carrier protein transacylase